MIRGDLRRASIRDVIDYVDYDVDPEKWIGRLLLQISSGQYEPQTPLRFSIGKSNGFSRTITQPAISDLVLYRTIVDSIYRKVGGRERANVYFKQGKLDQAQTRAAEEAEREMEWATRYRLTSQRSFQNWLRYAQYRKHLLLDSIHPYLVVTDVANFFDSLLHSHIEEALRGIRVSPRMLGLLFFLLERLSIRQDYSGSHGISLPVDQFDCSRTLAHITLFDHDDQMIALVGETNYVRWMDDQNMGVASKSAGLKVLSEVGKSLAKLHLTPNTKKSKVLSLSGARRQFYLDINARLDKADGIAKLPKTRHRQRELSAELTSIWRRMLGVEGEGEFDKVLRRMYRLAGLSGRRFLRRRAMNDILSTPTLADRVSDYMRCSGTVSEYLDWTEGILDNDEQVYSDVNVTLLSGVLRLEPAPHEALRIRRLAMQLLSRRSNFPGAEHCRALAPLMILRFGDRRSLPMLRRSLDNDSPTASAAVVRSLAAVYASYGRTEFREVRRIASRLFRNHLADLVRLVDKIGEYDTVPARYSARLDLRYDAVANQRYVDMRALLTARLLALSSNSRVVAWVDNWKRTVLSRPISGFDGRLLRRLL